MDRWTLPSFDAVPAPHTPSQSQAHAAPLPPVGVALPTIDEVQSIRAKAYQEAFAHGLQEGLVEGQTQGVALGREEGIEKGRAEGFQTGYQQGYQSGAQEVEQLARALRQVLQPDAITIADGAYTAAGTVVRRDVAAGELAMNVAPQRNIADWVIQKRPGSAAAEAAEAAKQNSTEN